MTILDAIYYSVATDERKTDPFETEETAAAFDEFYKQCVKKLSGGSIDLENDIYDRIINISCVERRNAFKVGFKAAMQLLGELSKTQIQPE